MRLAVVGHVEWVDFLLAGRLPRTGEIVGASEAWEAASGGGAMAAYALKSLTGAASFFCALGDDARAAATARGLRAFGLDVHAAVRPGRAQRRTLTTLTPDHERTITVLGPPLVPSGDDPLPWSDLSSYDGVLFFAGDAAAARACRAARVLVSSGRARDALLASGVHVDALVGSADDADELVDDALLAATEPRWIVTTEGPRGGSWHAPAADRDRGRWLAQPPPGPAIDAFGCGDAFAAALMAALADGRSIADACALSARVGAALLSERAPSVGDLAPLWHHPGSSRDE
jgi:ribokinase